MFKQSMLMLTLATLATSCSTSAVKSSTKQSSLRELQQLGMKYKNVLRLPEFETTPAAVKATADQTMATANAALDQVGKLLPGKVNFANTFGALDDIGFLTSGAINRLYLIKETSTNAAMREAVEEFLVL